MDISAIREENGIKYFANGSWVDLSKIPRECHGNISWKEAEGCKVPFKYYDIIGELDIVKIIPRYQDEDGKWINTRAIVKYKDEEYEMNASSLLRLTIGDLLGTCTTKYKYNVGDVFTYEMNSIKILEPIKIKSKSEGKNCKGYRVQCLNDGYIFEVLEKNISKKTQSCCAVCNGSVCIEGINDIATTHPHLVKYFANQDDPKHYTYSSNIKLPLQCKDCDYNCKKIYAPNLLSKRGFSCKLSKSRGNSYPERFMFIFLKQFFATDEIITQLSKNDVGWIKNGIRYDFYISKYDVLIEVQGQQHLQGKGFSFAGGKTVEEEQENDRMKKELALSNGIKHYFQIDCRNSEHKWIKNSILNSGLLEVLHINEDEIDWSRMLDINKGEIFHVGKLYSQGITDIDELMKMIGIRGKSIVIEYLKIASKVGICNYK